jgi:hypothetical protein
MNDETTETKNLSEFISHDKSQPRLRHTEESKQGEIALCLTFIIKNKFT